MGLYAEWLARFDPLIGPLPLPPEPEEWSLADQLDRAQVIWVEETGDVLAPPSTDTESPKAQRRRWRLLTALADLDGDLERWRRVCRAVRRSVEHADVPTLKATTLDRVLREWASWRGRS